MGGPNFYLSRTYGALKSQKEGFFSFFFGGGGGSLIKARNYNLPYFGIMFEGGPELFLNYQRGHLKNMNAIRLGSGNVFCSKNIFSSPPPPPIFIMRGPKELVWIFSATGHRTGQIRLSATLTATVLSTVIR